MITSELMELFEDGVAVVDARLNLLQCNQHARLELGITQELSNFGDFLTPDELVHWRSIIEHVEQEGTFRTTLERASGKPLRVYAGRNSNGEILLTLRAVERSADTELTLNAYARVLAKFGIGLWRNDVSTGELWWSPHCYELLDIPEGPISTAAYLKKLSPEDQALICDHINREVSGTGEYAPRFEVPLDDGVRHLEDRTQKLFPDVESDSVYVGATRDRTRVAELQARCDRLESLVQDTESVRATSQLASAMAHDLNNVMTAMLGNAELLRLKSKDSQYAEHLDAISVAARHASALSSRMLDFVRRRPLSRKALSLVDLTTENLGFLRTLVPANLSIELRAAPDASVRVSGDRHRLEQVLYNLILNAGQASGDDGRITITISADADAAELTVADNGRGIPEGDLDRVFDPFYTTRSGGAGLGLSSVRQIVEQHEGTVTCRSELGVGTTFIVTLPYYTGLDPASPTEGNQPPERRTIWVAEDDNMVRVVLEQLLRGARHEVRAFARPHDLLSRLDEGAAPPDLIISDVVMPEMSGPELFAELRKRQPALRVLFISGYADDQLLASFRRELEAGNLLHKPFKRQELFDAVEDIMQQEPMDLSPASTPA